MAGGLLYTGFQFGAALGLALVTIVLVGDGSSTVTVEDYRDALLVPAGLALAAALVLVGARKRPTEEETPSGLEAPPRPHGDFSGGAHQGVETCGVSP